MLEFIDVLDGSGLDIFGLDMREVEVQRCVIPLRITPGARGGRLERRRYGDPPPQV